MDYLGMKIYNKLNISQDFLPSNYPKSFDFIVTKLNHKIDIKGWETEIGTLSTSNIDDILYEEDGDNKTTNSDLFVSTTKKVPYKQSQQQVARLLKLKGLTKEQVAGVMGNIQQESNFNPFICRWNCLYRFNSMDKNILWR